MVTTPMGVVEYAGYGAGPAVLALHGAMGGWDQSLLLARTIAGTGPSAIHFALRHRDRCRALVLVSTCAGSDLGRGAAVGLVSPRARRR